MFAVYCYSCLKANCKLFFFVPIFDKICYSKSKSDWQFIEKLNVVVVIGPLAKLLFERETRYLVPRFQTTIAQKRVCYVV